MNRKHTIAFSSLCLSAALVAIGISGCNKDKREEASTGHDSPDLTTKPVAIKSADLKKLAGPELDRVVMRMDRDECIAAIQRGNPDGKPDDLLEKLLSRLAVLDPVEALELGSAMDPVPNIQIWLGDVQIERMLAKHEPEIAAWLSSFEASTKAESSIKARLLTGIVFAKPPLAVRIYAARKKNFNEDDLGRVPVSLSSIMLKNPDDAFKTCAANFEDETLQARHLKTMLQVGIPPELEEEIERSVISIPSDEVRKAAMEGLIYGYERRKSAKAEAWKKKLDEEFGE